MAEDGENRHAVSCIKKGRMFGAICVFITSDPADNALTYSLLQEIHLCGGFLSNLTLCSTVMISLWIQFHSIHTVFD